MVEVAEQDNYEFELELLLGEIPNMASENPHSEEERVSPKSPLPLKGISLENGSLKASSPGTLPTFYSGSPAASPVGLYSTFSPGKSSPRYVNGLQDNVDQKFENNGANGSANLPDQQSLASALTQLSLVNGCTAGNHLVSYISFPNHALLLEDQYLNNTKQPQVGFDVLSCSSSNGGGQEPTKFASKQPRLPIGAGVANGRSPNCPSLLEDEHYRNKLKQPQGSSSSPRSPINSGQEASKFVPWYTAAPPSAQSISSLPGLHPNYVHRVGFPGVPCVFTTQSAVPYYVQQQVSRPHVPCQYMDGECYDCYFSQFRSDAPDANHPYQANARSSNGNTNGGARQSQLNMYSTSQFDQNDHLWDKAAMGGRHGFPEKILTKSDGLNMLKAINGSSSSSNGLSNNHYHQQSAMLNSGSLYLDGRFSPGSSPDSVDPRMYNLKSHSLDEVVGSIYFVAKDQHGCRFLQKKCAEGCAEDVQKIFVEIIGHIVELMTDPFGNYLVQKLLEVCTNDQKMKILHAITRRPGDLIRISLDMHGTRAVQKVIDTLGTPEQFSLIVSSLKPGIINLMKDTNGNHVAQRCLHHLSPQYKEFLFEDAVAHCSKLAKDRYACCVLQQCLTHCDGEHRRRLVRGITSDALHLSQNQYGNYVVQFVLELRLPWATAGVLDKLEGSFGYLSMQKYSSHVVEKCLKYTGEDLRPRIVQELISDCRLDQILQDPYGNYVIQVALNHSKGAAHAALVEAIKPQVASLRTSPYGKKILSSNGLKNGERIREFMIRP